MPSSPHLQRRALVAAATSLAAGVRAAPDEAVLPSVAVGRLERLPMLASAQVAPRHVDVWLPPGFQADGRHAVLYMHDGQMLYDPASTWNRQAWQIHLAVDALMRQGRLPPTIVVGIWNHAPARYAEYFPEQALAAAPAAVRADYLAQECHGRAQADAYLRFIVEELRPLIQARYAPRPGPATVMGSSMGGLISLYALCEYPEVFRAAGALSAHWPGRATARGLPQVRNAALPLALLDHLQRRLPPPGLHRLWVDRGDDALDSLYAPALTMFSEVLRDRGYDTAQARVQVHPGTGHNEADWGRRAAEVLAFLAGG